ncbi:hypothetical protein Scep_014467 [Stephania cephalantha]|uniref:Pentatricopeptide repeat-containing protein n=1 Tax=Stephania cephalantha TaxID=152367 RepID=A0AAP0P313_9MAGN
MFQHCRRWKPLLLSQKTLNLSSYNSIILSRSSFSAVALQDLCTSIFHLVDPVEEIVEGLKSFGSKDFLNSNHVRTLISCLNNLQVEHILYDRGKSKPDSALFFFDSLRNEYGFHLSRVSQLIVCHIFARKGHLKALRIVLRQILDEEDGGHSSAPSLCNLLWRIFKEWDYNELVWDVLANVYSRLELVDDAFYILGRMKDLKFQPSISTYDSLMYSLKHSNRICDIYEKIKASGVPLSKYTNAIFVDGLCKQFRLREAIEFFWETEGKKMRPSLVSFNSLLSGFCSFGFVDIAKSFFCMMLKFGVIPDEYSYNTLIHGLFELGSVEEALKFYDDMQRHGVEPDVVTYSTIANGFQLLGLVNEAWEIIHMMLMKDLDLDQVTYTILICGHCRKNNIEGGLKLREEMLAKGFQLSIVTYSILLNCLFRSGHFKQAMELLDEMKALGLDPDLITYSILIYGFCKQGELENAIQKGLVIEAKACFDTLTKDGLATDVISYNIMIDRFAKLGKLNEAMQLYDKIFERGMSPTVVTYNSLTNGHCKTGRLVEAEKLLQRLLAGGLVPSAVTYSTLIDAYSGEGKIDDMLQLLNVMKAKAVIPTTITYTIIIKGLCKQRRFQESENFLKEMHDSGLFIDQITYNTLIQGFCEAKDMTRAFHMHNSMQSRNLQPTPVTYNLLISRLCMCGELKEADKLLAALSEQIIRLTKPAYTTLIKAYCAKGNSLNAISLFKTMVDMGYEVSIKDYAAVINRLCKRCLVHEAKMFLSMMLKDGIFPDKDVFNAKEIRSQVTHRVQYLVKADVLNASLLPEKINLIVYFVSFQWHRFRTRGMHRLVESAAVMMWQSTIGEGVVVKMCWASDRVTCGCSWLWRSSHKIVRISGRHQRTNLEARQGLLLTRRKAAAGGELDE